MKRLIILWMALHGVIVSYSQEAALIKNVSVVEFKEAMDSVQDEVILDVRTLQEIQKGKIPGAIGIDFYGKDFEPAIGGLDRNRTYLLYCAGGIRSGKTAELMKSLGFKKIYNLEVGYNGWVRARMPVEKGKGDQ